jgi:hypothetical protein
VGEGSVVSKSALLLVCLGLVMAGCAGESDSATDSGSLYPTTPDVVGQSIEQATATLEASGFDVAVAWDGSGGPPGQVMSQLPEGDSPTGVDTVTVHVVPTTVVPTESELAADVVLDQRRRVLDLRVDLVTAQQEWQQGDGNFRVHFAVVASGFGVLYSEAAAYQPPSAVSAEYTRYLDALSSMTQWAAALDEGLSPSDAPARRQTYVAFLDAEAEHRAVFEVLMRALGEDPSQVSTTTTTTHPQAQTTTTTVVTLETTYYYLAVTPGSCRFEHDSLAGTIRNTTSQTLSYQVFVVFLDGSGVRIDDATATVRSLRGGETATWEAVTFEDSRISTCRVDDVSVYEG